MRGLPPARRRRADLRVARLASADDEPLRGVRRALAAALRRRHRGAAFHRALALPERAVIITKGNESGRDGYSAFEGRTRAGTTLADDLRSRGVTHLVVGGLATDYCVRASVLDARRAGFEVTVLTDAIRGVEVTPGDSARALEEMRPPARGSSDVIPSKSEVGSRKSERSEVGRRARPSAAPTSEAFSFQPPARNLKPQPAMTRRDFLDTVWFAAALATFGGSGASAQAPPRRFTLNLVMRHDRRHRQDAGRGECVRAEARLRIGRGARRRDRPHDRRRGREASRRSEGEGPGLGCGVPAERHARRRRHVRRGHQGAAGDCRRACRRPV